MKIPDLAITFTVAIVVSRQLTHLFECSNRPSNIYKAYINNKYKYADVMRICVVQSMYFNKPTPFL